MTEREDELAWRERILDEKKDKLNRIDETLAGAPWLSRLISQLEEIIRPLL